MRPFFRDGLLGARIDLNRSMRIDYEIYFTPRCEVFCAEDRSVLCNSGEFDAGGDYNENDDYEDDEM